ncbi:hypothetical protein QM565_30515 [Geitlerinema splendidum]|nr:hypothetical protein [Geitlerinema splendidum]
MAVTDYLSIDGQVYGHSVAGDPSKTTYYTLDALGSVVATTDNKGNVLNTYEYKPFSGEVLQKTGTAPDPRFMWNGSHGYRTTNLPQQQFLTHYVRARHYQGMTAALTSVDPLWPQEPAYRYVGNMVTSAVDPSGMRVTYICGERPRTGFGTYDSDGRSTTVHLEPKGTKCVCYNGVAGRIRGLSKGHPKYKCLQAHCQNFCISLFDLRDISNDICQEGSNMLSRILNCTGVMKTMYTAPCTSGAAWAQCGNIFTCRGGSGYVGTGANKSNYPAPAQQSLTAGGCCVECKMRVCCAHARHNQRMEKHFLDQVWRRC